MMFAGFFTDVYLKYKMELQEAKAEIHKCGVEYTSNYCDDKVRPPPPALMASCVKWLECSQRNADLEIKLSNVLTRLIAETVNDFT